MWEVKSNIGSYRIEKETGDFTLVHSIDGENIYTTPYRIEAQQIADELNGESNASN